ncbi:MAG: hypothetical protein ACREWG_00090 [Gammaproteobacteria bacterium]
MRFGLELQEWLALAIVAAVVFLYLRAQAKARHARKHTGCAGCNVSAPADEQTVRFVKKARKVPHP